MFSIVIWGSTALEALLRSDFPLSPIPTATGNNTCRVCVPLLHLPPSFRLQSLGLSTPATTAGVVVFTVLITYLGRFYLYRIADLLYTPRPGRNERSVRQVSFH